MARCPTPKKTGFPTARSAGNALRDPGKMVTFLTPHRYYRCRCGQYHLTSKPKRH